MGRARFESRCVFLTAQNVWSFAYPCQTAYWSAFLSLLPLSVVRPVFLYLPPSMFTCKPLMMENLMHGALHTPTAPISRADFLRQPPWRTHLKPRVAEEGRVAAGVRPSHLRRGLVSLSRPTVRVRGRCSYDNSTCQPPLWGRAHYEEWPGHSLQAQAVLALSLRQKAAQTQPLWSQSSKTSPPRKEIASGLFGVPVSVILDPPLQHYSLVLFCLFF